MLHLYQNRTYLLQCDVHWLHFNWDQCHQSFTNFYFSCIMIPLSRHHTRSKEQSKPIRCCGPSDRKWWNEKHSPNKTLSVRRATKRDMKWRLWHSGSRSRSTKQSFEWNYCTLHLCVGHLRSIRMTEERWGSKQITFNYCTHPFQFNRFTPVMVMRCWSGGSSRLQRVNNGSRWSRVQWQRSSCYQLNREFCPRVMKYIWLLPPDITDAKNTWKHTEKSKHLNPKTVSVKVILRHKSYFPLQFNKKHKNRTKGFKKYFGVPHWLLLKKDKLGSVCLYLKLWFSCHHKRYV